MSVDNTITLASMSPGQRLEGVVKKVTLSGAIIDVGAEVDGLLHISDLGPKQVTRASSVLAEGQQVVAWVKRADLTGGRLALTMVEPPRFSWADLQPGFKTVGKVVRLETFGAFVDIGADTEGLVHVSEMSKDRLGRPSEAVAEGDQVTVWVKEADRKSRRISLSLLEPPAVDMRTLKPEMVVTGKVTRLESYGAFVDIGAGKDGMIHVSEMGHGYIGSPSEVLSVNEEVQVRVLAVDPQKGKISLSMKDLPAEQYHLEVEDQEDLPSSMELALRQAMEAADFSTRSRRSEGRKRRRERQERDSLQDDIISRTLRTQR